MIIKSIEIEKFRAFQDIKFSLGKRLTAISGRNATQKTTLLGMIGQPFTISQDDHPLYGCQTIDGYNFKSQFKEKFKISPKHDIIGEHRCAIVYLEPKYSGEGMRMIEARNISTSNELNTILNDINLTLTKTENRINVYCEDEHATSFLKFLLTNKLEINPELYMRFIDIDLSWTHYVQLYEKEIPEFRNNIILLDADVLEMKEYLKKRTTVEAAENIEFLPLTIEKDLFSLLKVYSNFNEFQKSYSNVSALNYDICFKDWALNIEQYSSNDFKHWFFHLEKIIGDRDILFKFWTDRNQEKTEIFLEKFIHMFNELAERNETDSIPVHQ